MRIKCDSVEAFKENMTATVHRNTVHVNRSLVSRTTDPVTLSHSVEVMFQASAVVQYDDGSEALVECGVSCGVDLRTADGDDEGSRRWDELYNDIVGFCSDRGLTVKPGVLDI